MLALAMVAVSVGFGNLAAAIALGVGGVSMATRIRVLLTFGLFEAAMPIVGLLIGAHLATSIGRGAKWVGAGLLIAVGCYGIISFVRNIRAPREQASGAATGGSGGSRELFKVALSALALSLDNLIVGFALGSYQVNLAVGALVFGVVSITMSLAGLELGARLGRWVGESSEMIGGIVLVGVGLALGLGVLG